jgi:hypothetical protein
VKRNAPLAIDPDAIAQRVTILQLLKLIAAWNPQIIEVCCAIELPQFAPCNVLNVRRQLATALANPDNFGFGVGEGADHDCVSFVQPFKSTFSEFESTP